MRVADGRGGPASRYWGTGDRSEGQWVTGGGIRAGAATAIPPRRPPDAGDLARLLKAASTVAFQASSTEEALRSALALVCEFTGWPLGHVFMSWPGKQVLVSSGVWYPDDVDAFAEFVAATESLPITIGHGLPGRIMASEAPSWITDVRLDANFPRRRAAVAVGIAAAFGFPVITSEGVEAVLEIFALAPIEPDPALLDLVSHIGLQLGMVIERRRAREALEASEARLRALVEFAPDAWVVVDDAGTITLVNEELQRLSGYQRDELLGQPVEVLVAESARPTHSADRAGYLWNAKRRTMGAGGRLRLRRKDGAEVPVDISLSPIEWGEGSVVAAAIRDVSAREAADQALRDSEARLSEAQRLAHIGSFTWDSASDAVTWSTELYRIYGLDPAAGPATLAAYLDRVHPEDRERVGGAVQHTLATEEPYEHEYRIVLDNGRMRWVHARGEAHRQADGVRLAGYCQDITQRRDAEDRRRQAQVDLASHEMIMEAIARGNPLDATLETLCREVEVRFPDVHCSVLLADKDEGVLRHAAAPTLPQTFRDAIDRLPVADGAGACGTAAARCKVVIVADILQDPLTAAFTDLAVTHGLRSVWSHPLLNAVGEVLGTFALYRQVRHRPDRTELRTVEAAANLAALAIERSEAEEALAAAARVDPLTGLPNRARFLEELRERLRQPRGRLAVLFLDLDRFKWINDSLGHPAGDEILVHVASRFNEVLVEGELVARFGGDEFTVLVDDATPARVAAVSERIESMFVEPFPLHGAEFFLSVSIGVAFNDTGADAFTLVRDADTAMYAAKEAGRARRVVFDAPLRERALARVTLEADLRRAIEREEFVLHYQPIVDFLTGTWTGHEALVRWEHPTRGLVGPDAFIPLAEETGLIVPLGVQVLHQAIRQVAAWTADGQRLHAGVNVSVVQLCDPNLVDEIEGALRRYGVPPELVFIEITESAVMEQLDTARVALERLAGSGMPVLIDDFGTGYSSIARLGELPVIGIKIDRAFTMQLGHEPRAAGVVGAITALAHAHDLLVVAEGIEDDEARRQVIELGCNFGQGYHFARPAPADRLGRPPATPA